MKKALALLVIMLGCSSLWAANDLTIVPVASIHNGDPGMGSVSGGVLDVAGMAPGSPIYFDVVFENIDFNLAGYQFELNYPANLLALSTSDSDWDGATGAVATPGAFIAGFPLQQLPATDTGALVGATALENSTGKKILGVLLTDPGPGNRPTGSAGTPNAGGAILRVCFTLNPNGNASCNSTREFSYIQLSATVTDNTSDIFADDSASRVVVGTTQVQVQFGDSTAFGQRGDASQNGTRGLEDAIIAARCNFFGKASAECNPAGGYDWANEDQANYDLTFDYNCNGSAGLEDAIAIARLAFGLQNRTTFGKRAVSFDLGGSGTVVLDYEGQKGALSFGDLQVEGLKWAKPYLSDEAKKDGWAMVREFSGDRVKYVALNITAKSDMVMPTIYIDYESKENMSPRMTWADSGNLTNDSKEFGYVPALFEEGQTLRIRDARENKPVRK